jgi:hypothetical protein
MNLRHNPPGGLCGLERGLNVLLRMPPPLGHIVRLRSTKDTCCPASPRIEQGRWTRLNGQADPSDAISALNQRCGHKAQISPADG